MKKSNLLRLTYDFPSRSGKIVVLHKSSDSYLNYNKRDECINLFLRIDPRVRLIQFFFDTDLYATHHRISKKEWKSHYTTVLSTGSGL